MSTTRDQQHRQRPQPHEEEDSGAQILLLHRKFSPTTHTTKSSSTMSSVPVPMTMVPIPVSFPSDLSVQSCGTSISIQSEITNNYCSRDNKTTWLCSSCSYRNSDMYHSTCAVCGYPGPSNSSSSIANRPRRHSFDSNSLSLLSNSSRLLSLSSTTNCSRTTATSSSTHPVSNCRGQLCRDGGLTTPPPTTLCATTTRRSVTDDDDDGGASQPPSIRHTSTCTTNSDEDSRDDCQSVASEDTELTYRRGSLSIGSSSQCSSPSGGGSSSSNNIHTLYCGDGPTSCSSSSIASSPSIRRKVPHEDPIEQPRHAGIRRCPHRQRQHYQQQLSAAPGPVPSKFQEEEEEEASVVSAPEVSTTATTTFKKQKKRRSLRDFVLKAALRTRFTTTRQKNTQTRPAVSLVENHEPSSHTEPLEEEDSWQGSSSFFWLSDMEATFCQGDTSSSWYHDSSTRATCPEITFARFEI
jgi:ribosomal protein L37E